MCETWGLSMQYSTETSSNFVYLDYSQSELDRAYTQTEWANNIEAIMQRWDEVGQELRSERFCYAEHAYGDAPEELLDIFNAPGPTVHFHIHGGAWQRQSTEACSFMAHAMRRLNVPLVVPEFGRLPETRMPDVLDQIARALVWTYENCVLQGKAESIVIIGHSSGAHMAALLSSYDFGDALPISCLSAILCISGSYKEL
jgi:arylformamidase